MSTTPTFLTYDEDCLAFINRTLSPGHTGDSTSFWDWFCWNQDDPDLDSSTRWLA